MMEANANYQDSSRMPVPVPAHSHPSNLNSTVTRITISHIPSATEDADLGRPASRQSNHSAVSSVTFPQLKRKQKQHKINATRMTSVVIAPTPNQDPQDPAPPDTSTCIPTEALDHLDVISNPPLSEARVTATALTRSNTAPSPSPKRKPPASHSSYGVETVVGPPPSFTTQRTLSQERIWKLDRSKSLRMTLDQSNDFDQPAKAVSHDNEPTKSHLLPAVPLIDSSPETADTQSIPTPTDSEQLHSMDGRKEQGLGVSNADGDKSSSESQKSEDLFLNIARTDARRPTSSKSEKRRSRVSLPFFTTARPASSRPSPTALTADAAQQTPRPEQTRYFSSARSHIGQHVPGTVVRQGSDASQELDHTSGAESSANSSHGQRRSSTFHYESNRSTLRANAPPRTNRLVSENLYLDRTKVGDNNATTESTISTAAPSTVWDELDDLKSRIRKLELTGKLPSSSAAAMSNADRPRTATTAATTTSGSPKQNKPAPTMQSAVEGIPSNVHPLLHEALGNAKSVLTNDVYQKLQSTAQDALQLASMVSFDTQSMRSGITGISERQIRRRTESMCRSLTELAIAMAAEQKPAQPLTRPGSREMHATPSTLGRTRRYSQNIDMPERPPVTTRVQSRLESRRTSAQLPLNHTVRLSPDYDLPTALPQQPTSASRVTRVSSGLRTRRTLGYTDGANEAEDASPSVRPVSRAMTEVAARRSSRDYAHFSREYTNQHPLPTPSVTTDTNSSTRTPLPPHLSTNFTSRRKYASPVVLSDAREIASSPLAAREPWGRITLVPHDNQSRPSDTASEAPGSARSLSNKRSFGFASRISSVSNRLRAAKAERAEARVPSDTVPQTGTVLDQMSRDQ